jgi:hypothetical protein
MKKFNKYGADHLNNTTPNTFVLEYPQPKVISVSPVCSRVGVVEELILTLNLPGHGNYVVKVWKEDNRYKWYDSQAPIKTRSFLSIEHLMWEYELPQVLKKELEALVDIKTL